jgi:glycosyltransferase involved in cell wall biosynthesis
VRYIDLYAEAYGFEVFVIAVDDGSSISGEKYFAHEDPEFCCSVRHIKQIEVVSLVCNLGHQRAIAVGLCQAFLRDEIDVVIVMDCDGEDKPEDLERLVAASLQNPMQIVVAQRSKRSEGITFRTFYLLYKFLFWLLTGKTIDFGNFCLIPKGLLGRVVYSPDTWNNLAVSLLKSRIPIFKIKTHRGKRYAGKSKMNLVSLVIHALSAISVYTDIAFVRIILLSFAACAALLLGIIAVILLRLVTELAIPGWASYVSILLGILLVQTLMFSFGAAFFLLTRRSQPAIIPIHDSPKYVRGISIL